MSQKKTKTKSSSTGTATTTPNVPSWLQGPAQSYYSQVGNLIGNQANTYGPTANQSAAFSGAQSLTSPNSAINGGIDATRSLLNYAPGSVSAGQLSDTDLSAYMNPYTQNVIDTSMNDLNTARQRAISGGQGQATAAGAYGGSRHGVADALTNESFLSQAASLSANLRNTGYNNAQNAALTDIGNRMNADQFNVNSGLSGAGLRLGAANQLYNQGVGADANSRANLGTQAALGTMERDIQRENDPQNAQMQYLSQIYQLLGIDPSQFIGQTLNQSGTSTGSSTQTGFSFGWSPNGGFSIGG